LLAPDNNRPRENLMLRGCRFAALMFCFAIAGCASFPGGTTGDVGPTKVACKAPSPCTPPVNYEHWPEQCTFLSHCKVIAPETIEVEVTGNGSAPTPIVWTLPAGSHFHFADDGVQFEKGADSGFTCPSKSAGAQRAGDQLTFTCDNAGKKSPDDRGWKYWIRLEYGLVKHGLDPWVVNR
jgi:hypothetical protein